MGKYVWRHSEESRSSGHCIFCGELIFKGEQFAILHDGAGIKDWKRAHIDCAWESDLVFDKPPMKPIVRNQVRTSELPAVLTMAAPALSAIPRKSAVRQFAVILLPGKKSQKRWALIDTTDKSIVQLFGAQDKAEGAKELAIAYLS